MTARVRKPGFREDCSGSSLAEFALVLPLALIFLLGLIDAGRFLWNVNQGLKAAQMGARWAAATDFLPNGLIGYSFVIGGGLTQGDPVPSSAFPGIDCSGTETTAACVCAPGGTCDTDYLGSPDNDAWQLLTNRMQQIMPSISADKVHVKYRCNPADVSAPCLGYAGDPTGADVAPFVTVSIEGMEFQPLFLFGAVKIPLPDFSQTLTMEDGQGTGSN